MGNFLKLIVLIGAPGQYDAIAFSGIYSSAVWQEANYQASR